MTPAIRYHFFMSQPTDPLLGHARREALVVLAIWLLAIVWTLGVCYGWRRPGEEVQLILGMPDWIFAGVLLPWIATTIATLWFGIRFMQDDDLGIDQPEATDG